MPAVSGLAKEGVLIQFNDVISECLRKPSGKARLVIDVAANKSASAWTALNTTRRSEVRAEQTCLQRSFQYSGSTDRLGLSDGSRKKSNREASYIRGSETSE